MNKLEEIYIGWKNYIFKSEEHEELAKKRMAECIDCEDDKKVKQLTNLNRCKQCGCYMPAKVRNEGSQCPIGKW